ncbi:TPA: collagenase-like protease [Candidatus Peregrinibacteria bacterium]|nr:collagenase-like protease [Candidatus Peregrinibacteria bacterium]
MNSKKLIVIPELMAPVGSFASLNAALNAGADSVYFGIDKMNMRARAANNFTLENVAEVVQKCRKRRVKTYLTINIVLYDEDLDLMRIVINRAKDAGIDAIIASDMSAILYARTVGMGVHASTQLSISNIESVCYFAQFADTIVLARELSLPMIKKIVQFIERKSITGPGGNLVRIEVFAHGALCVSQSGRCHLSLFQHNASANRGMCLQTCRRKYRIHEEETGHELILDNNFVLSPADLCTIGFLDQLVDSGISVLKIEGRGRSADYVDCVVRTYREALGAIKDGQYTVKNIQKWENQLKKVFHRGLGSGYYLGKPLTDLSGTYGSQATEEKIFVGKIIHYYPKIKVAELEVQANEIKVGDQFVVEGDSTGVVWGRIDELRVDDRLVKKVFPKCVVTLGIKAVRRSDKFYLVRKRTRLQVA